MIGDFHEVLNCNQLFVKLNRFICNYTKYYTVAYKQLRACTGEYLIILEK
jgi:hypothetical protein